ncbi:MAG: Gfo/Idh/MocA family oxidoreductase [Bdellovibrionota bacterium]
MTIKTCVIGCGSVASGVDSPDTEHVLSHGKAINAHPKFSLSACYDLVTESANEFQKKWGAEKVHLSIDEVFEAPYDLYVICSSTDSHYELLDQALESNCKGIICEKPLVSNLDELCRIEDKVLGTDKKILVNFTRRFDKAHQELAEYLEDQPLGPLLQFNAHVSKGIVHNGSHLVDMLLWFFGGISSLDQISGSKKGDDLIGCFRLVLENGIEGIIQVVEDLDYSLFDLDLIYKEGRASLRNIGYDISVYKGQPSSIYQGYNDLVLSKQFEASLDKAFYNLYETYAENKYSQSALKQAMIASKLLYTLADK